MRFSFFVALLVAFVTSNLTAQEISATEYAARRDSLAAHIDSGVVVAFGGPEPVRIGKWTQLPAFNYLTGFEEPNAAFLLVKQGGRVRSILFTASRDPRRALYDGFPPDSSVVARETGLN